jgi:hypothetical protein
MAVMARETWTDHRLDDLNKKVDDGFNEMRTEFRALRGEMAGEFQAVRGEVAAMNRNLIQLTWGLIGMMLVGFLGIIATILTQV